MGFGKKILDAGIPKDLIDSGSITAFGKPDPPGTAPHVLFIMVAGGIDLGPDRFPGDIHERQKSMGGTTGHNFQDLLVLQNPEGPHQVPALAVLKIITGLVEAVVVHLGQGVELGEPSRTFHFTAGQFNELSDMTVIALLKQGIGHHGDE